MHIRQPEQYRIPPKVLFQDKNSGETNKRRGNIPKRSSRGRSARGIREGKMPIKGEDMATKEGSKKRIRENLEKREKK